MNSLFVKIPRWVQLLFTNFIWSIPSDKKEVYLTFDDGPTPEITEWVIRQLKKHKAKATFFCIGKNIEAHPEIFKIIIQSGHRIGNHTHNHLKGWNVTSQKYLENIQKTERILKKHQLSNSTKLFRPPYGKIKKSQTRELKKLGYSIVMWDILSADFDNTITVDKCLRNVLKNAKKGSVIVFHDSSKASHNLKYTLPKVLEYYSKKGYVFKAIN